MCCIFFMSYKKDISGVRIGLFLCKSEMLLDVKEEKREAIAMKEMYITITGLSTIMG